MIHRARHAIPGLRYHGPVTEAFDLILHRSPGEFAIAVQVPSSHPLPLAEDVATVDHLSKGRLEFGGGRSGMPGHYQGFNIPYSESRDRFLETLSILATARSAARSRKATPRAGPTTRARPGPSGSRR